MIKKASILITTPSINKEENVSGIANLTSLLIENNPKITYFTFTAGKKDNVGRNLHWLMNQLLITFSFLNRIRQKEIDLLHLNMPLEKLAIFRDTMFAFLSRLSKKPYIIHIRGGVFSKNIRTPWLLKSLVKMALKKAIRIIVLGDAEKNFINEYYNIEKSKITVLPNCVKVPEFSQKTFGKTVKINILYLGRIDKNKGLNEIILSLSTMPTEINYSLNIAGDGPDTRWFIDSCSKSLTNKYIYKGVVYGDSKEKLLEESHIFLLPSYFEGLPNALLEAMSYGVVPIVTPVGSIPEVINHEENGLIVNIKNWIQIKDAIAYLINNENAYRNLSWGAYVTTLKKYSLDYYIKKLNEIYYTELYTNK